jgi:biopolymer transport protein ExbD
MTIRNHYKLICAGLAITTLATVLFLLLTAPTGLRPESQVIDVLVPARESRPMFDPGEGVFNSDNFMVVEQTMDRPAITDRISDHQRDAELIQHDCGTLTVSIDGRRNITLNTDTMGSLTDTSQLSEKLSAAFRQRVAARAYLPGMETRTDLPDIQRIPRTVLIRVARSVSYGDVVALIDLLKGLRADPIGLQINRLPA